MTNSASPESENASGSTLPGTESTCGSGSLRRTITIGLGSFGTGWYVSFSTGASGVSATSAPSSETVRTANEPGTERRATSSPLAGSRVRRVVVTPSFVVVYSTDQSRLGTAAACWKRTCPARVRAR